MLSQIARVPSFLWLSCCSVTQSCSTLCNPMDCRLPSPPLSPGVCSNSSPLSWWCYPTTPSSVTPFSSCPQSFPASGSFPMSLLFTSGDQSIWTSALASVHPVIVRVDFLEGWLVWSPCSPRDSQESSLALYLELLDTRVVLSFLIFIFCENSTFFHSGCTNLHSQNWCTKISHFSTSSLKLIILCLMLAFLMCVVISHYNFLCVFSNTEHISMYLLPICRLSLENVYIVPLFIF